MDRVLQTVAHRPYPLPRRPWRLAQRWNDLLFAHWPVRPEIVAPHLPGGLELDRHDGSAWLGVVPFVMDRVRTRVVGQAALGVPGARAFPELNLRTYVRSRRSGRAGVYFFSLDAGSLLAVLGARTLFHLPYFWARMRASQEPDGSVHYTSERRLGRTKAAFNARYRGSGEVRQSSPGSVEAFLTERYCLFTPSRGRLLAGDIHHLPWPLEPAEAEFARNELDTANGMALPSGTAPLLHFARELEVYLWALREDTSREKPCPPHTPDQ